MGRLLGAVALLAMLGGVMGIVVVTILLFRYPAYVSWNSALHEWWLQILPCLAAVVVGFIVSVFAMMPPPSSKD